MVESAGALDPEFSQESPDDRISAGETGLFEWFPLHKTGPYHETTLVTSGMADLLKDNPRRRVKQLKVPGAGVTISWRVRSLRVVHSGILCHGGGDHHVADPDNDSNGASADADGVLLEREGHGYR